MKKIIRRVYSNDFSENSMTSYDQEEAKKARKKKRLVKAALYTAGSVGAVGALGGGAYAARNTKAGLAVRKFTNENGGAYLGRKSASAKNAAVRFYGDKFTRDGRAMQKALKGRN